MTFNDTSTYNGLIQDCEFLTDLGDGAISGDSTLLKHFTRLINKYYYNTVVAILKAQDSWDFDDSNLTTYPQATTPMVASQRDYTFPTSLDILKIKRVDVTYNGTNWYRATHLDSGSIMEGMGNESLLDNQFTKTEPRYDLKANALLVYPRATSADVTSGASIRIEFYRKIDEFTSSDTTQELGFDEPFHGMVSAGASMEYAMKKGLPIKNDLATLYSDFGQRLEMYYGKKNIDEQFSVQPANVSFR